MANVKRKCPKCSGTRKNKTDKPLSYDTERKIWKCHHCNYTGCDRNETYVEHHKVYRKPDYVIGQDPPRDGLVNFFHKRGIGPEILTANHIEVREHHVGGESVRCIAFPYFRDGEVVNVKYRTADKRFVMESGAELTLYGLDNIKSGEPLLFVEGEIDKLSAEVAGYVAVSVPNGAGTNLDLLAAVEDKLVVASKYVLAGDSDAPGVKLQSEIQRRLGPEKCWRVEWPEDCKDANEVLVKHGVEALRICIEAAKPVPIEGVFEVSDIWQDLLQLYREGRPRGVDVGWDNLKALYRPRLGGWTVITGSPSSGKSSLTRALFVNLAARAGWKFLVFPPEDCPPAEYISLLCEIYMALPFDKSKAARRMDEGELREAADWVNQFFYIMDPPNGQRNFEAMLEIGKQMVMRRGINALVIDPWNRVEHIIPSGMNMHQYIGQCLGLYDTYIKRLHLHGFIVAHPKKLLKEADGSYPVATMYDISDSAHWFNMPDFGLSIWRDKTQDSGRVEVHVQKVRHRWCGITGSVELHWDRLTGRFTETPVMRPVINEDIAVGELEPVERSLYESDDSAETF